MLATGKVKRDEASLSILMDLEGLAAVEGRSCWWSPIRTSVHLRSPVANHRPNFRRQVEQYSDCSGLEFLAKA